MVPADGRPSRRVLIIARTVTTVVSIAGAEGILWFGGYPNWWGMDPATGGGSPEYQADADLGWKARQGQFNLVWADRSDLGHPFLTTNWSGGRRATAEKEPPPGTKAQGRVLFFGDSYIQGYGLSDSETLPWMVQKKHPELEVSNYGAGLYGTYQSYLSMKKWVHEPASVYYLFNSFHEERNAGAPSYLRISKKPPEGWSYPYAAISHHEIEDERSPGEVVWPLSLRFRTVALVQDYKLLATSFLRLRQKRLITQLLLEHMNQTVQTSGGKFTVLLFDLDPEERRDYRQFLEAQHIEFIDCERPELHDLSLRLSDRQHPTRKLNEMLAGWIEPVSGVPAQTVSLQ